MSNEAKLNIAASRGVQAEDLLQNELLKEAFQTLEQTYISAWSGSAPHEREARESYWRALQVLADVQNHIKGVARDGRVAKHELDALAKRFQPNRA